MNEQYLDFYTKDEIDAMIGGLNFVTLTQEQWDALTEKNPTTIYYVFGDRSVTQYMGEIALSSGTDIMWASFPASVVTGTAMVGDATWTPIDNNEEVSQS